MPTVALVVSSTGGAVVTITVSVASPTFNTGLKPNSPSATTSRFSWVNVLNPLAATVTVYVPGCSGAMVYAPAPEVVRVVDTLVATFVAVTVALGIAAPVLSVTVPVMVPSPAVCAFSVTDANISANRGKRANTDAIPVERLRWKLFTLCVIEASYGIFKAGALLRTGEEYSLERRQIGRA